MVDGAPQCLQLYLSRFVSVLGFMSKLCSVCLADECKSVGIEGGLPVMHATVLDRRADLTAFYGLGVDNTHMAGRARMPLI